MKFNNDTNSIEVRWYRSRVEEAAGIDGECLIDYNKYLISDSYVDSDASQIRLYYILGILNFKCQ